VRYFKAKPFIPSSACHHKLINMETQPNSVELIFQRLITPTFDEFSHFVEVVFIACFKAIAVMENKSVVLWRDELVVDVRLASCEIRCQLWTTSMAPHVIAS